LKTHLPVLTDDKTRDEINFLEDVLQLPKGAKILDIPCGHARHAILLAQKGYQVTGIDIQDNFIKIGQQNAKDIENISIKKGDMRDINYENEFAAVINMFTSFGYFSDQENFAFLKKMARAL